MVGSGVVAAVQGALHMNNLGARVYGLAAINLGILGLLWGEWTAGGISMPKTLPGHVMVAYVASALLVAGGVLINWKRAWGAALLTALFALDIILLCVPGVVKHIAVFGYWDASAEPLALAAAGLIAYAASANIDPQLSERLQYAGRAAFALCLFSFGWAHFAYLDRTVSMVPSWLPPSQMFWAWFTALAAIAAGLALLSGVQASLAARLLTLMYIIFGIFVHTPILMAGHTTHFNWTENGVNYALVGAAWIVADALAAHKRASVT
jgi:uncharacterized membrane protein YphA (DoxX/SURF4 family)